MVHSTV